MQTDHAQACKAVKGYSISHDSIDGTPGVK